MIILSCLIALVEMVKSVPEKLHTEPNAAYDTSMEHLATGRYISAIDEFDKVLKSTSVVGKARKAQAYIGRGRAKTALRNFDLAIQDFEKPLKLNPAENIEQQVYFYRAIAVESLNH